MYIYTHIVVYKHIAIYKRHIQDIYIYIYIYYPLPSPILNGVGRALNGLFLDFKSKNIILVGMGHALKLLILGFRFGEAPGFPQGFFHQINPF